MPQFCSPNCDLLKTPREFHFASLRIFSTAALGGPHPKPGMNVYEWSLASSHKTINPLNAVLCSIKTFCPLRQQISSLFSPLCLAHSHIQPQTLHQPVSKPPLVSQGDLWGRSRVRQASSAPGGLSQLHLYSGGTSGWCDIKTSPVEPTDWHIPNSVSPSRVRSATAIKRNEFFWGEVGCDLQDICFTATNENVLAPRNQTQDAFSFLSRSSHET